MTGSLRGSGRLLLTPVTWAKHEGGSRGLLGKPRKPGAPATRREQPQQPQEGGGAPTSARWARPAGPGPRDLGVSACERVRECVCVRVWVQTKHWN